MTAYADLNWSSLRPMADSAKECLWYQENEHEDTPATIIGTADHVLVLEPDEFEARYYVPPTVQCEEMTKNGEGPQCSRNAVPGSTKCRQHGGTDCDDPRIVLTEKTMDTVRRVRDAIFSNPDAMAILEGTERERVITWTMHGVRCKARLDAVAPDRVIDVKTCRSLATFARQQGDAVMGQDFARRLYHGQMAWYLDGYVRHLGVVLKDDGSTWDDEPSVYIIAAETNPPYDSAVFELPPYVIDAGRVLYERLLDRWKACREVGEWPGRWPGITELQLPPWAMGDEEGF